MNLDDITPLILTYNEAENIHRCLARLTWARRVVVVDSGSNDGTTEILAAHPTVDVFHRDFDSFADQCNFGLNEIRSEWTLSMDSDYILSEELIDEITSLAPISTTSAYSVRFRYCIYGQPLIATLYPPRLILYRTTRGTYHNEGHGHRVRVPGRSASLRSFVLHDDRKPLSRWFRSQINYAWLEAEMLDGKVGVEGRSKASDRLRRCYLAPLVVPLHCLFVKGLLLNGWRGLYYTFQRSVAELMIATALLDRRLQRSTDDETSQGHSQS